ncbi:MAG: peptidoglycan DD-metalloendopeptidase family protein [Chloroflexi bacterium]|nr:peptidoglycan DD-metalloendopeptidase family protein [Chloroflexota bacterium]
MKRSLLLLLALGMLGWAWAFPQRVHADETGEAPYYIVQPGDTLSGIAYRFGLDMQTLAQANGITNPASLQVGQKLRIPGLEGVVSGQLSTRTVKFGESLTSLSRALGLSESTLQRLNHLLTPYQLFAGRSLILPADAAAQKTVPQRALVGQESLLEVGLAHGQNPWTLAVANQLPGTWAALPGDVLILPGTEESQAPSGFPSGLAITPKPTAWVQGHTGEVWATAPQDAQIEGAFGEYTLHFFPFEGQRWVALQGVSALADPGLYPVQTTIALANGKTFAFLQAIPVKAGNFYHERLQVPTELLDPKLNREEAEKFAAIAAAATPTRYWDGIFRAPEAPPLDDCHPSYFGTRRNYNDTFFWYHTGLDFCGRVGTPIYAPADGVVVFTGTTEIHGNVTIIDHGWGVYTTYCHQDQILVQKGQRVHAGDLIGKVGRTGRVTGPHLHWEVWVGDVPVDPLEWLERAFP